MRPASLVAPLAAALLLTAFWATASACGWFLDWPFVIAPIDHPNALESSRFLRPNEAALILTALALGTPLALVAATAARRRAPGVDVLERAYALLAEDERAVPVLAAALSIACAAFVAYGLVGHTFILDDERAYAFQADAFAHFKIGDPAMPAAFRNNMLLTQPLLTGKYPPGNALVMTPAVWIGAVSLVHPLVSGATAIALWGLVRETHGPRQAALAAAMWTISPFVWCIDASLMAFGTAALELVVALWMLARLEHRGGRAPAIGAGLALGALFVTRPLEAVCVGLPFAVWFLVHAWRARAFGRVGWALLGFAALAWLLPWHNQAVTGSALRMPYSLDVHRFGLGFTRAFQSDYRHTPSAGAANVVTSVVRLDSWLLGFPGGAALVLAGLARPAMKSVDTLVRGCLAGVVAMWFLIPGPGTWDVGPTYGFIAVPMLIYAAARGTHWAWTLLATARRPIVGWALAALAATALVTITPLRLTRLTLLAREIEKPWDAIAESKIGEAAVVLPKPHLRDAAGWGFGYPYAIPTGPGTSAHLFEPFDREEYAAAMARLGDMPVYVLVVDAAKFAATGERSFRVVPFDERMFDRPKAAPR